MSKTYEIMTTVSLVAMPRDPETGKVNWHSREQLWSITFRRDELMENHWEQHKIDLKEAELILANPMMKIQRQNSFWREQGKDLQLLYKIRSRKGQVTRIEKSIKQFKENWTGDLFETKMEDNEDYKKLLEKLSKNQLELESLINQDNGKSESN